MTTCSYKSLNTNLCLKLLTFQVFGGIGGWSECRPTRPLSYVTSPNVFILNCLNTFFFLFDFVHSHWNSLQYLVLARTECSKIMNRNFYELHYSENNASMIHWRPLTSHIYKSFLDYVEKKCNLLLDCVRVCVCACACMHVSSGRKLEPWECCRFLLW